MSKKIGFILAALILHFSLFLSALDRTKALTQYMLDSWDDEQGLPQNSVHAVLQTHDGYLWLGTEEGLARFDGVRFKEFNETNTPEIKNNYITCLYEDKAMNLWIGTRGGGLARYSGGKFKHFGEKEGLTNQFIDAVSEDKNHDIWIGTDRGGLFKLHDRTFTRYTTEQGLPIDIINYIYPDSRGNLWIATIKGLCHLKDNRFSTFSESSGLTGAHINSIYEDASGSLWIGAEKGLYRYENGDFTKCKTAGEAGECNIRAIFADSDQNLWLGTGADGLARYDYENGRCSFLTKKEGLSDNSIRAITEDREGNLWIGTAFGGLNRLRDGKFTPFGGSEGLSDDVAFSIYEDRRNGLWIGTNNGLNLSSGGKFRHFTTADGLSNNVVNAVVQDSLGFTWVCTDDGLNRLSVSPTRIQKVDEYLRKEYLVAVVEDRSGNLWAGTLGGLFKMEATASTRGSGAIGKNGWKGKKFVQQQGLAAKVINFIYEDSSGNIWISTLRKGLTRYRDGKFTLFSARDGLVSNSLNCIYEDGEAVLWIGSIDGLSRFKQGKFFNYTRKEGLFNNNIYRILEDGSGNLWMSCNKGIFRVDKKDLNDFADRKINRIVSTPYGKKDGMRSSECNGGYQGAGCKTKDGRLWFPTMKGVVCIDPEHIKTNRRPPPVYIEQVLLDGAPAPGEKIKIEPGIKRIEFLYTAASFIDSDRVKFKYKLAGYDGKWIYAGAQRTALYTNLDPGEYRFDVTACNSDALWNEKGAAVQIRVIPPFWGTWWFIFFALAGFAAFSYLVINFFRKYIDMARFWRKQKFIGRFRLLNEIGVGGMGAVYKAKNLTDEPKIVAVKVLKEDLFRDERNRKRFKQEAAIIDQLDHPNIVKVFERGENKHNSYIAMELLEGKTLAQKISEEETGKMDLLEAVDIVIQATDALKKIHSKNIVHRDLKPENIMLIRRDGNPNFVKLLDFGLARTAYQTRLTRTGAIIGTIDYLSPEQIGRAEFSAASDIYSLGVIFYEMLTGAAPFNGETTIAIMKQIINETPIEPAFFCPGIPPELNDLVMAMLSKDKTLRPTAEEVSASLKELRRRS